MNLIKLWLVSDISVVTEAKLLNWYQQNKDVYVVYFSMLLFSDYIISTGLITCSHDRIVLFFIVDIYRIHSIWLTAITFSNHHSNRKRDDFLYSLKTNAVSNRLCDWICNYLLCNLLIVCRHTRFPIVNV